MTPDGSRLQAALSLAARNYPIFPVGEDRRPLIRDWPNQASVDPAQIATWWRQWPGAIPAMPTGARSGVTVLDIDVKHGHDGFKALDAAGIVLPPDAYRYHTASGGGHVWFRHAGERNSASQIGDGLDIRGEGGYVAVWGALGYPFAGSQIGLMPPALSRAIQTASSQKAKAPLPAGDIPHSTRNDTLTRMAGVMRQAGLEQPEILAALRQINEDRCDPPLDDDELETIAGSIGRYPRPIETWEMGFGGAPLPPGAMAQPAGACEQLGIYSAGSIEPDEAPRPELVQAMLHEGALSMAYGESNSGKTFWALSLARAVATGAEFHGRKTRRGKVLYLASESPGGVRRRILALQRSYSEKLSDIHVVKVPVNFFSSAADADLIIRAAKELSATGEPVRLIIGDTLARISAGANENSGEDMGAVMDRFERLTRETGAHALLIHHQGKNAAQGARGWSGIRAVLDTEIEVTCDGEGLRSAEITKQRDLPSKNERLSFRLDVVKLGKTSFGEDESTCIAREIIQASEPVAPAQSAQPARDKLIRQTEETLRLAWVKSGAGSDDQKRPRIDKKSMLSVLKSSGLSDQKVRDWMKTDKYRTLGKLVANQIIKPLDADVEDGWIIIDPEIINHLRSDLTMAPIAIELPWEIIRMKELGLGASNHSGQKIRAEIIVQTHENA